MRTRLAAPGVRRRVLSLRMSPFSTGTRVACWLRSVCASASSARLHPLSGALTYVLKNSFQTCGSLDAYASYERHRDLGGQEFTFVMPDDNEAPWNYKKGFVPVLAQCVACAETEL